MKSDGIARRRNEIHDARIIAVGAEGSLGLHRQIGKIVNGKVRRRRCAGVRFTFRNCNANGVVADGTGLFGCIFIIRRIVSFIFNRDPTRRRAVSDIRHRQAVIILRKIGKKRYAARSLINVECQHR